MYSLIWRILNPSLTKQNKTFMTMNIVLDNHQKSNKNNRHWIKMESLNKSFIRRIGSRLSNQGHDFFLSLFIGFIFFYFYQFLWKIIKEFYLHFNFIHLIWEKYFSNTRGVITNFHKKIIASINHLQIIFLIIPSHYFSISLTKGCKFQVL